MSIALTNAPALGGLVARVTTALTRLSAASAQRAAYRQTRRELNMLSDRDLADIGLTRADISRVAAQASIGSAR